MMWSRLVYWVAFALYGISPFMLPLRTIWASDSADPITNSIGMTLSLIPEGEFMMGSHEPPDELAKAFAADSVESVHFASEQPSHRVRICKSFYLSAFEVTRGQFRQFIDDTHYQTDSEKGDRKGIIVYESVGGMLTPRFDPGGSWRRVGFEQTDEHPVVAVSWTDATAFCRWLSSREGRRYRLPTEAEWEYACRAGSTTRYFNGDDPQDLTLIGNVADAQAKAHLPNLMVTVRGSDGYVCTAPVGKFKANGFGLYDMHGNVWEWCADWYDGDYYKISPTEDPAGPATGFARVRRGGGWDDSPRYCRSASRLPFTPVSKSVALGFRVVLECGQE